MGPNGVGKSTLLGTILGMFIKVSDPQFEGQTKTKLGNSEIKAFASAGLASNQSLTCSFTARWTKPLISELPS